MNPSAEEAFDARLQARLRHDAASFGSAPSPEAMARLATIARSERRVLPWRLAAAAAGLTLAITLGAWATRRSAPPQPPQQQPAVPMAMQVAKLEDVALRPLRTELDHLLSDSRALARGMWRQVPAPIRGWLE